MTVQVQKLEKAEQAKQTLIMELATLDAEKVSDVLDIISKLVRAFTGKDINPGDAITKLIDVHNILERSYFPSMPEINFQVYCRLLSKFYPDELQAFEDWADCRAHALKSLKGYSSELYADMFKAQVQGGEQGQNTNINLGPQQRQDQQQKRRFGFLKRSKAPQGETD